MAPKPPYEKLEERAEALELENSRRKSSEETWQESEEFMSSLLENSPTPILVVNPDTSIRYVNPTLTKLTGYSLEEVKGKKVPYPWWIEGDARSGIISEKKEYMFKGTRRFEKLFRNKDGDEFWVEINTVPIKFGGEMKYSLTQWVDITERKRAEERVKESEEHHRLLLEAMPDPVIVYDPNHKIAYANDAFEEVYGWTKNELIGGIIDFVPSEEVGPTMEAWRRTLSGERVFLETRRVTKEGRLLNIQIRTAILKDQDGNHSASIVIHRDVTELKQAELERKQLISRLNKLATIDSLTGANNRRHFLEMARSEFSRARRYKNPFSILMIDIDFFKSINDSYGHHVGDRVLRTMAQQCIAHLRENDIFGRIGGEEFGAVLVETKKKNATEIAERLRHGIETINVGAKKGLIHISISIGLTSLRKDDDNLDMVVKRADKALYQAKENGRNRVVTI